MCPRRLYVVTKDMKEPHIADDMAKTAMHKHGCENFKWVEFIGYESKTINQFSPKLRIPAGYIELAQKNHHVCHNNSIGYKWKENPGVIIFIWEKH